MNTTALIGQWSMEGAERDLDGRFRSVQDVRALFARETKAVTELRASSPWLAKPADGATWEALLVDASEARGEG